MSSHYPSRVLLPALALSVCLPGWAAAKHRTEPFAAAQDAAWTREYAAPFVTSEAASTEGIGRESWLNLDPRFAALLRSSFPQKQWFWHDQYRFTSVPELIQEFIGVPGDAILDNGRYVTVDGGVPHAAFDRGMLWIDTGQRPALLIFAGANLVAGGDNNPYHLWVFSSAKVNWTILPSPFLTSLRRWISIIGAKGYRGTAGYHYNFVLATFVQPNGEMQDIFPSVLHLSTTESGAKE